MGFGELGKETEMKRSLLQKVGRIRVILGVFAVEKGLNCILKFILAFGGGNFHKWSDASFLSFAAQIWDGGLAFEFCFKRCSKVEKLGYYVS
ncbi:MAG: hypothetical protein ACTS4U_00955 [Candidatus Hodgkinia cicadicola]